MIKFWNNTKTAILLAAMFALILGVGSFFGREGLIIAFVFGGMMNFVAYFFSDKIALTATGAQEVDEHTAPELVRMVADLAQNAGLPMPRVYIAPQQSPNAFATGRSPKHAAVAVTQGALQLLAPDELRGVIGHELGHVKNRDTLTSCVAATIAGAISFLAQMAMWSMMWGGGGRRDREGGGGGLELIGMLLMVIFAPLAATLIQLAISRSREFVADQEGARIAGTPRGLINALQKLEAYGKQIPLHHGELSTFNNMFIIEPFTGSSISRLFATHPSTEDRIARLRELM